MSPHRIVAILIGLAAFTFALRATANTGGIAGYTGKSEKNCNSCHTGGTAPTVTLEGPDTLEAGKSAEYTLTVVGDDKTGGGVAATDGVELAAGDGFKASNSEMIHKAPQGATGTFKFTVTAPEAGDSLTLWAVGLGGGALASSSSKAITKDIAVTGGAPSTKKSSKKPKAEDEAATGDDDADRNPSDPWNDTQECSTTQGRAQNELLLMLGLVAFGLALRRRIWASH